METPKGMIVAGVFLLLAGCAGRSIRYDFDGRKNFSHYRTYAWTPAPRARPLNPFMEERLKRAVEKELMAKSFRLQPEGTADFLVSAYTLYHPSRSHSGFSIGMGMGFLGVGASGGARHPGMTGSIVLEIEDASTRELIWKCTKDDALEDGETPEDAEADVAKAVAGMLGRFPPKPAI